MKKHFLSISIVLSVLLLSVVFSSLAYAGTPCRNLTGPLKVATFPVIIFTGFVDGVSDDEKCDIYTKVLKPYIKFHKKSGDKVASLVVKQAVTTEGEDIVYADAVYFLKGVDKKFLPMVETFGFSHLLQEDGKYSEWQPEEMNY